MADIKEIKFDGFLMFIKPLKFFDCDWLRRRLQEEERGKGWMVCLTLGYVYLVERYIGVLELSYSGANE